ncbi:MAG: 3'-5' exonuclease domain-containing protein 2 [Muribaculaceae bacterium]|nr:3'-5' exonuclease domain-containing protein 2 [Muribaculaceae bacterium]
MSQKPNDRVANFEITISKEELNHLEPARFEGEIFTVNNIEEAERAVCALSEAELIGFDTETKPAFKKGVHNNVALMQLATENVCFLFRLSKIGMPEVLKNFIENPEIKKVGLSIKDDFFNLNKLAAIKPAGFVDLQDYVKEFKIKDCALTKIHSIIFGKRISKNQQLTNWEAPQLTQKQQEYAALDAQACVRIFKHLKSGGFDPLQSQYKRDCNPSAEN